MTFSVLVAPGPLQSEEIKFSVVKLTGLGSIVQITSLVPMGYHWAIVQNKTQGNFVSTLGCKLENDI